jgi:nucleoside 2-deoxyribosyltransferase
MRVYLGGPINGCTDEEANGWRELVKPVIAELGHVWVDPMVRDYRGREMEPGIAAEIVENDKADVESCDVLLMNCPKPSVGTSMEIFYGWTLGKRVIAVVPYEGEPSPWIVYHTEWHRGSVVDAARKALG